MIGVLAIILAVVMTISSINTFTALRDKAKEHADIAPNFASYCENTTMGLMGILGNIPTDDASLDQLQREIEALQALEDAAAAPAEEAPAEETEAEETETEEVPAEETPAEEDAPAVANTADGEDD